MQTEVRQPPRQRGDAQGQVGAHFAGTIAELSVADLIQMLLLTGRQAVITVARDGTVSQVWCAGGEIVDAESGASSGEAALYRILGLERGSVVADWREVARERTIYGNATWLLLEGARRKDESDARRAKLGGEQRCYQRAGAVPEPTALSAMDVALLRSLSEARTVSQVLASSEQGELETLLLLAGWVEAGVVVDVGTASLPSLGAGAAERGSAAEAVPAGVCADRWGSGLAAPPRRATRFWVWGVLGALVLVPAGYLLGASSARTLAQRVGRPAPTVAVEAAPPSYPVQLEVEPADAQITLDGEQLAVGQLDVRLPSNGQVHDLRVTASGFIPASIRFLDAAPPKHLRLEPLPLSAPACEAPVTAAGSDDCCGAKTKLQGRAAAARDTARRERKLETRAARPQRRGPAPAAKGPQLQASDRPEPVIDVIN